MTKLGKVLLVDDYEADNFLHQMLFEELNCAEHVAVAYNGVEALQYLTTAVDGHFPQPDLICVDINMPVMNGWEFVDRYDELPAQQRGDVVLMMLSTSLNPDDASRASAQPKIAEFISKPLTLPVLEGLLAKHFPKLF